MYNIFLKEMCKLSLILKKTIYMYAYVPLFDICRLCLVYDCGIEGLFSSVILFSLLLITLHIFSAICARKT